MEPPPCALVTGITATTENDITTIMIANAAMINFALQSVGAFFNKTSPSFNCKFYPHLTLCKKSSKAIAEEKNLKLS